MLSLIKKSLVLLFCLLLYYQYINKLNIDNNLDIYCILFACLSIRLFVGCWYPKF